MSVTVFIGMYGSISDCTASTFVPMVAFANHPIRSVAVSYRTDLLTNIAVSITIVIVDVIGRQPRRPALVAICIARMIIDVIGSLSHRLAFITLPVTSVIVNVRGIVEHGVSTADTAVPMVRLV